MISELMISFTEQVKKTKNPFFGTFLLVWLVRNWTLVLTLFNLDLYETMDEKIEALKSYFTDVSIAWGFLITSLISLAVIVVTYLLTNLSRLIINMYETWITPKIYEWTAPNKIVLLERYQALEQNMKRAEDRYESEKRRRLDADSDVQRLEQELISLKTKVGGSQEVTAFALTHEESIDTQFTEKDKMEFIEIIKSMNGRADILRQHAAKFEDFGLITPIPGQNDKESIMYKLTTEGLSYQKHLIKSGQMAQIKKNFNV